MVATINTEVVMACVKSITDDAKHIKEESGKISAVLSDLAAQTNIKPINQLDVAFATMQKSLEDCADSLEETYDKTRRYVDAANDINDPSNASGLYE